MPAVPGVLVAIAGLYIAHWFSAKRDRRKEVADLCKSIKELADSAAESAVQSWNASTAKERVAAIAPTRRRFQSVGIAVTDLRVRTARISHLATLWRLLQRGKRPVANEFFIRTSIDAGQELVAFRKAAMQDPFDDVTRPANPTVVLEIESRLASFQSAIDRGFSLRFR